MTDYPSIYQKIISDPHYQKNLDWGDPRPGHPEGSVRAHIAELDGNLEALSSRLSPADYWALKLLIHTHDTFKSDALSGVSITDPKSHASLAKAFLQKFCDDADLLNMIQYHDEPYAIWRQFESKVNFNQSRLENLLKNIHNWNLFLAFLIIDGCTKGKSRKPLQWFFGQVAGKVKSDFTEMDILGKESC